MIEVSWTALKSSMVAKGLASRLQWIQDTTHYTAFLFDSPMDLSAKIPITNPKNAEQFDFEKNYKSVSNKVLNPVDTDNSSLARQKVTQSGWSFQLHSIGVETGKFNGVHNKKINPSTLEVSDLAWSNGTKFASLKLYKEDRTLITAEADEAQAHYTVVDWAVDHEMEIVGALLTQNSRPASDIWFWVIGAPGIANVPFGQGGINIKRLADGTGVDADGKAPKYIHPTKPLPGVNRFRMIFHHPTYIVHPCQVVFRLFKP